MYGRDKKGEEGEEKRAASSVGAGAYKRVAVGGSVWSAGVGACASGVGCVLQSIIRNTFGYVAISIVLNRRASFCGVAEKWLKRNKSISGI